MNFREVVSILFKALSICKLFIYIFFTILLGTMQANLTKVETNFYFLLIKTKKYQSIKLYFFLRKKNLHKLMDEFIELPVCHTVLME